MEVIFDGVVFFRKRAAVGHIAVLSLLPRAGEREQMSNAKLVESDF